MDRPSLYIAISDNEPVSEASVRCAMCAVALALTALWSIAASATDQRAAISPARLFGAAEIHSSKLDGFPQWREMRKLFEQQLDDCGPDQCARMKWYEIIGRLRSKSLMTKLREINAEMNKMPYVADQVNWHMSDYWATPLQFLERGGDCEDFAIAKYMTLRELGVPVADMRLVVLNDLDLHIAHAVLAVYVEGNPYILDNRTSDVVAASAIDHYQPVYSVNDNGWWLHWDSGSMQLVQIQTSHGNAVRLVPKRARG